MATLRTKEQILGGLGHPTGEAILEVLCDIRDSLNGGRMPTPIPDAPHNGYSMAEVRAIVAGKKIQAIKEVRTRLGLGLKEAKEYVEASGCDAVEIRKRTVCGECTCILYKQEVAETHQHQAKY